MVWAFPLAGAVKVWDGSASGNWSTSANWTNNLAPFSGDDVVFPANAARFVLTNNLPNLRLRSITFLGSTNYTLHGNPITLSNGITALQASGRTNVINLAITNAGTQTILVSNSGASLALNGILSGMGGLNKTGAGHLLLGGAANNTFEGVTTVSGGTLELNDTSTATQMIPGNVVVESGATLSITEANQIADTAQVTVNGTGLFTLNNYNETIAGLTLNGGGDVWSGFGTLTVLGDVSASASFSGVLNPATISGNIAIGSSTRTIQVADLPNAGPECEIAANLLGSGSAGIVKTGAGALRLSGTNTFAGLFQINGGTVHAASALAFGGGGAGTEVNSGGLVLEGAMITNESLVINAPAALLAGAGNVYSSWQSNIVLNGNIDVQVFTNGVLNFGGAVSGPGGVTKSQPGTLRYSGNVANTYSGNTTVNEGTLEFAKSSLGLAAISSGVLTIGDGLGGPSADVVRYFGGQLLLAVDIHINDSGLLDLNGITDAVGAVTVVGGRIDTRAGTLSLFNTFSATSSTNLPALIFGNVELNNLGRNFNITPGGFIPDVYVGAHLSNGGLTKTGDGSITLAASNGFAGSLTATAGEVRLLHSFAAGPPSGGVVVIGSASLYLDGSLSVGAEPLYLGRIGGGTVLSSAPGVTNSWAGDVVLQSAARISVESGGQLDFSGTIWGAGELIKESDGTLRFSGATPNAHTSATTVEQGTLLLSKSVADGAIIGPLVVGSGLGLAGSEVVRYGGPIHQIANSVPVLVNVSGLLDFNGVDDSVGALSGEGHVELGAGSPGFNADGSSSTFDGFITGSGPFRKLGAGTLTLTGGNTNPPPTLIAEGTLNVNGVLQNRVTVGNAATLSGEGTVGQIINTAGGSVAPGNGVGVLTSSNIVFGGGSAFMVQLHGTNAGTQYDQLDVRGTNNISGSTLQVRVGGGFAPREGQSFVILSNDAAEAITGTFAGLPNGSVLTADVLRFVIRYNGGSGNDIVLTLTNVPARALSAQVTTGNGNGLIEANECNHLSIAITNTSGVMLSNVTARLSTTNARVIIPAIASKFPDVPVNGRSTNAMPFQISTLPGFVCGTPIELALAVQCNATSAFTTTFTVPTSCSSTGSAFCGTCPGSVSGSIAAGDAASSNRLARTFGPGSSCATPTECPGKYDGAGLFRYDVHRFTNTSSTACYTVYLDNSCGTLFAAAYLGTYNPTNVCANYLGDSSSSGGFISFSFPVPAGSNFTVVVNDIVTAGPTCPYLLVVSSDECAPDLSLAKLPSSRLRLSWPTSAAGYLLDGTADLSAENWTAVTNQPVATGARFTVTNIIDGIRFYRLRRPD